jgi:hypothetical protein
MGCFAGYNPCKHYEQQIKRWKWWSQWLNMGPPPAPPRIMRSIYGHEMAQAWDTHCNGLFHLACKLYRYKQQFNSMQMPVEAWNQGEWPALCCSEEASRMASVSDSAASIQPVVVR